MAWWQAGCLTRRPMVSLGSLCSCQLPSLTLYFHHTNFHYLLFSTRTVYSDLRVIEARMEHSHPLAVKGQVQDLWMRSLSSQLRGESWFRSLDNYVASFRTRVSKCTVLAPLILESLRCFFQYNFLGSSWNSRLRPSIVGGTEVPGIFSLNTHPK